MLPRPLRAERHAASNSAAVHGFVRTSVGIPRSLEKKKDFPSREIRGLYSRALVLTSGPSGTRWPNEPTMRKLSSSAIQDSMFIHSFRLIVGPRFSGAPYLRVPGSNRERHT